MMDSQARQSIVQDLHRNLLVEASAGSGKTHSLVERLVAGILQGVYRIEQLAAVTFTRKAAAELSGRLRLALEAQGSAAAQQALVHFETMFVGTVHSFCARLLREYPVQANISPGFQEMEEDEDRLLQRKILRLALEEPEGRSLLPLLREFGASSADLLTALSRMSDHGELDYPAPLVAPPDLAAAWAVVDELADYLEGVLPDCADPEPTCKLLTLAQSLVGRRPLARRETPQALLKLLQEWESNPYVVQKYWEKPTLGAVRLRVEQFRQQLVIPQLGQWRSHLYSQCIPFLLHVRQACQRERQQSGLVNFNDLLRLSCQLVRHNPEVRSHLQERLRHLCVDEFQDTDPLQAELFFLLASDDPHQSDWTRVQPRPASLFLVGDPKQSIYRFCRADIETYNTVRRRIEESGGEVLSLLTSFRSTPPLCAWINRAFSQLLPAQSTPQQARFQGLGCRPRSDALPALHRLVQSTRRHQDVASQESLQIVAIIQAWLGAGYQTSDFLILTARKAELRHYQRALVQAGIACQVTADPAPLSPLGRGLLRLLQVVANGQDKIALVGVLRGSLFGHSDEELFLHFQGQGAPQVEQTMQLLHSLRATVGSLPLGAAVQRVVQQVGLHLRPDSEIEGIVDYLGERGQAGLTLAQATAELFEAGAVPLPPSRGGHDGVRVLNLHKAKGLEARVVFLAAPTSGLPLHAEHTVVRSGPRQSGALCLWRNRKRLAHPPHWEELEAAEVDFLRAEHTRLLYVAATRAKEHLIVGQWTGTHGSVSQPWAALAESLGDAPILAPDPLSTTLTQTVNPTSADQLTARAQEAELFQQTCLTASWQRHSVTASNHHVGLQANPTPPGLAPAGPAWGDLIHRLLEQLVSKPDLRRDQLRSLARWFSFESPELHDHLEEALDTLETVRQSDFWSRVLAARERLVEVPFGHRLDCNLLFGTIDLALQQAEGWDIIDYKTDRKRLQDLISSYAGQVQQYARSWVEITDQQVQFAGIYAVRQQQLTPDVRDQCPLIGPADA